GGHLRVRPAQLRHRGTRCDRPAGGPATDHHGEHAPVIPSSARRTAKRPRWWIAKPDVSAGCEFFTSIGQALRSLVTPRTLRVKQELSESPRNPEWREGSCVVGGRRSALSGTVRRR